MEYTIIIQDENQDRVWTCPDKIDDLGKAIDAGMDQLAKWADIPGWPLEIWVMDGYYGPSVASKNVTQDEARKWRDEKPARETAKILNLSLGTRGSLYKYKAVGPIGSVYATTGAVILESGFIYASPDAARDAGMKALATDGQVLSGKYDWPIDLQSVSKIDEERDTYTSHEMVWKHTINYYAVENIGRENAPKLQASVAEAERKCQTAKEIYEKGLMTPLDYASAAEHAWMFANGEIQSALGMDV